MVLIAMTVTEVTIDSRIPGFYRMSIDERIAALQRTGLVSPVAAEALAQGVPLLSVAAADKMIENVIGTFGLPFAIAPNFLIDGEERLVPMVVEEPSIVAGLSGAAKIARETGGFFTDSTESLIAGQIQLVDIEDPDETIRTLHDSRQALLDKANLMLPRIVARGGGCRDIEFYKYRLEDGSWTVMLHVLVDSCDAMGANVVNSLCENLAPELEALSGRRVLLRILSNLADRALVTATVTMPLAALASDRFGGERVRDGIVTATRVANADPHRAATHNKGIMNGVDAVAIATGNDWRAIEASAHAYAADGGRYRSLSDWAVADDGNLIGRLELPLKVGIVGGSLEANPGARLGLDIAAVRSARELASIMCSVGLAQNFAALRALAAEGIQEGHMRLHARSVASAAGVPDDGFDAVVDGMVESGEIKTWKASELAKNLKMPAPAVAADPDAVSGVAAGKVILLGEHAVVYGRHAVALPLTRAVVARVWQTGAGKRLMVRERGVERAIDLDESVSSGMAAALDLILRRLGVDAQDISIHVDSRIPSAMGLGSSAAYVVAIIRAFDGHFGLGLDDRAVNQLAFDCEKLAHGTPSGIDNNLATYAEPVLFSKSMRTRPIELAEPPPVIVAASGIRGITREQVEGVRRRFERSSALYNTLFDEIDELSVAGAVALRDADFNTLGAMMNVCQGLLNAIEVSTPELESMVHIARSHGAVGAKLTGAGGGGSIVALCPGCEDEVARALQNEGHTVIRLRIG